MIYCRDCRRNKPREAFYDYFINGEKGCCKACCHNRTKKRRQEFPKLTKLYADRARAKDPEHTRGLARKYYEKNREKRKREALDRYYAKKEKKENQD